jgi:hypothetical protein
MINKKIFYFSVIVVVMMEKTLVNVASVIVKEGAIYIIQH